MSTLEHIIKNGNRPPLDLDLRDAGLGIKWSENNVTCNDCFTMSVVAGEGAYCVPRPASLGLPLIGEVNGAYQGPFEEVEVGFPSERPEPWDKWKEYAENPDRPTETVYGYVPAQLVRDLIETHGGEAS